MAGLNKLTARRVKAHKTRGRLSDGGGLYLDTRPSGDKYWMFKRMRAGIARQIGLGSVDEVSLAEARMKAERCRALQDEGRDPALVNQDTGEGVTFAEAARQVIEIKAPEWRNPQTRGKWERNLLKHCKPMAARPVSQIESSHILAVLRPLWSDRNHTGHATRTMIETVLAYAKVKGWRDGDNPATWKNNMDLMISKTKPRVKHLTAMPYVDVPDFAQHLISKAEGLYCGGAPAALLFAILTSVRSNEVRGARWEEFDLGAMIWTVPPDRTKGNVEHVIPISKAAAAVIQGRVQATGIVFPGVRGRPMSDNTLRMVVRRTGDTKTTVHGFRSSFKDWSTDVAKARDEVSEMCLGHLVGDAARRAYARSDAIDDRRALMNQWGDFVMGAGQPQ